MTSAANAPDKQMLTEDDLIIRAGVVKPGALKVQEEQTADNPSKP